MIMKRLACASLFALGLWSWTAGSAMAQFSYSRPQVNPRPTTSPYLNLANGGNAATSYYGIIRPQIQSSQNMQQLQQDLRTFENASFSMLGTSANNPYMQGQNQGQGPNQGIYTGHPVVFGNYGFYFPMMGGGQGSNGGTSPFRSVNRR
jgi:hypothetical protein